MANQCVTEFTIIGPEEVIVDALRLMISNLKANGVAEEEEPGEDANMRKLTQWIDEYISDPECRYLEALSRNVWAQPMGWDAHVFASAYGELFTMRMDFDTRWGPAIDEVEEFMEALPSPCGIYWRPDTGSKHRDIWLKKDGGKEYTKLSSKFDRFKGWSGEIDVFYAQMHKAITNRLPKIK